MNSQLYRHLIHQIIKYSNNNFCAQLPKFVHHTLYLQRYYTAVLRAHSLLKKDEEAFAKLSLSYHYSILLFCAR